MCKQDMSESEKRDRYRLLLGRSNCGGHLSREEASEFNDLSKEFGTAQHPASTNIHKCKDE